MTLVYDLATVRRYVEGLTDDLNTAQKIINKIEAEYRFPVADSKLFHNDIYNVHTLAKGGYLRVFTQLKFEIRNINRYHDRLQGDIKDYQLLSERSKRSLIPILGKSLGYVAGLVMTDQLRNVKASIRNLESN